MNRSPRAIGDGRPAAPASQASLLERLEPRRLLSSDGSRDVSFDSDGKASFNATAYDVVEMEVEAGSSALLATASRPEQGVGLFVNVERFAASGTRDATFGPGGVSPNQYVLPHPGVPLQNAAGQVDSAAGGILQDGSDLFIGGASHVRNSNDFVRHYTLGLGKLDAATGQQDMNYTSDTAEVVPQTDRGFHDLRPAGVVSQQSGGRDDVVVVANALYQGMPTLKDGHRPYYARWSADGTLRAQTLVGPEFANPYGRPGGGTGQEPADSLEVADVAVHPAGGPHVYLGAVQTPGGIEQNSFQNQIPENHLLVWRLDDAGSPVTFPSGRAGPAQVGHDIEHAPASAMFVGWGGQRSLAVEVLPDGDFLVAGVKFLETSGGAPHMINTPTAFFVARYNSDGSPDQSFGVAPSGLPAPYLDEVGVVYPHWSMTGATPQSTGNTELAYDAVNNAVYAVLAPYGDDTTLVRLDGTTGATDMGFADNTGTGTTGRVLELTSDAELAVDGGNRPAMATGGYTLFRYANGSGGGGSGGSGGGGSGGGGGGGPTSGGGGATFFSAGPASVRGLGGTWGSLESLLGEEDASPFSDTLIA